MTLYANGQEIATKSSDDRTFVFEQVALKDGLNEIKAIATKDGIVDVARFNKVAEPNPSYEAPEADKGGVVDNWFDMPEDHLADVEVEEIEITDDVYSTRDSFNTLMENEEANAVIEKYLGNILRTSDVWNDGWNEH